MNFHVYTAHFKRLDDWGWSHEILFPSLWRAAGQTLPHLPSSGSRSITSCSVPLDSETTHTGAASGTKLLDVTERIQQHPAGRCSPTSHEILDERKWGWAARVVSCRSRQLFLNLYGEKWEDVRVLQLFRLISLQQIISELQRGDMSKWGLAHENCAVVFIGFTDEVQSFVTILSFS